MTQELFWKVQDLCHDVSRNDSRAKPFGGKHIILLGDPAQLPTVGMTFFRTALWMRFKVLLLKDVVRQADPAFIKLLASLRNGEPTEHAINMLQSRAATFDAVDPTTTTVVVSRRKTRDQLNEAFINLMGEAGATLHTYNATDTDIHGDPLPTRIQTTLQSKKYEKLALPQSLTICKGARVMLLRNTNIEQGWVNGTICEVETCTDDVIYVKNLRTGVRRPIFRVNQHISMHNGNFTACRKQFPIMPAFAVTIHKVQGSTLRRVAIVCDDKFFASGQMYVAISRVRNLEDLFLLNFDPTTFRQKTKLATFFRELLAWIEDHDELNPVATRTVPFPTATPTNCINDPDDDDADKQEDDTRDADTIASPSLAIKSKPATQTSPSTTRETYAAMLDAIVQRELAKARHDATKTDTHANANCNDVHASAVHSLNSHSHHDPTTLWQHHVCKAFPFVVQPTVINAVERSQATEPAHVPGFEIDTIVGDGNCFFRAISKEIFGTEMHHLALRATITTFIRDNHDVRRTVLQRSFCDTNAELLEHISSMQNDGFWATTWVIYATATYLQTAIQIYTRPADNWEWHRHEPLSPARDQPITAHHHPETFSTHTIHLVHTNRMHYDRAVPSHAPPCLNQRPTAN